MSKLEYLEELELQLAYVDSLEEYEEISLQIQELKDGLFADAEYANA